jgi:hypothetical protein
MGVERNLGLDVSDHLVKRVEFRGNRRNADTVSINSEMDRGGLRFPSSEEGSWRCSSRMERYLNHSATGEVKHLLA